MILEGDSASATQILWQEKFQERLLGLQNRKKPTSLAELPNLFTPPLSLEQQFEFLSCLPNSPFDKYLCVLKDKVCLRAPSLLNHFLFSPLNEEKKNNSGAPTSFRQRNLYFLLCAKKPNEDYVRRSVILKLSGISVDLNDSRKAPKLQRKRLDAAFRENISPLPPQETPINQYQQLNQYETFKEQMQESGTLMIRSFTTSGGYLIMNSCHKISGAIQRDEFVNILFTKSPLGELSLKCVCQDYKNTAGEGGTELDPVGKWMTNRTRCMHIRFLYDYFENEIKEVPHISSKPNIMQALCKQLSDSCFSTANAKVVAVSCSNFLVLSVTSQPEHIPVFVQVHPRSHDTTCFGKCKNRLIRNQPGYWLLDKLQEEKACVHIRAVVEETNLLKDFLKKPRSIKRHKEKMETFSKDAGKWISASLGTHKPRHLDDPKFHRYYFMYQFITSTINTN